MLEDIFGLSGKVALVTGAGRGIGAAAAIGLAEAGADVALVSRSVDELEEVANSVRDLGRKALSISADLKNWANAASIVEQVVAELGRIDILVNNAGIATMTPCDELTGGSVESEIAVNVKSPIELTRAAIVHFKRQNSGKIISITSLATRIASPQLAGYGLTKSALLGFTRTVAVEMASLGFDIQANCIAPGLFDTAMTRGLGIGDEEAAETVDPALRERARMLMERIPVGRRARTDEMKGTVIYLASPASSYVTGSELVIDGGWTSASP